MGQGNQNQQPKVEGDDLTQLMIQLAGFQRTLSGWQTLMDLVHPKQGKAAVAALASLTRLPATDIEHVRRTRNSIAHDRPVDDDQLHQALSVLARALQRLDRDQSAPDETTPPTERHRRSKPPDTGDRRRQPVASSPDGNEGAALPPIVFDGTTFRDPAELGPALPERWSAARRMVVNQSKSHQLRGWLRMFNRNRAADVLSRPAEPDRQVAQLIAELAPQVTPSFDGYELTDDSLALLARRAVDGDWDAGKQVRQLFDLRILRVYSVLPGRQGWTETQKAWRQAMHAYQEAQDRLPDAVSDQLAPLHTRALGLTLHAVVDSPATVAADAEAVISPTAMSVPWFRNHVKRSRHSPLDERPGLAALTILLAPIATRSVSLRARVRLWRFVRPFPPSFWYSILATATVVITLFGLRAIGDANGVSTRAVALDALIFLLKAVLLTLWFIALGVFLAVIVPITVLFGRDPYGLDSWSYLLAATQLLLVTSLGSWIWYRFFG